MDPVFTNLVHDNMAKHLLRPLNAVVLSGDPDDISVGFSGNATLRWRSHRAELGTHESVKGIRKIDIGAGFLLEGLDDVTLARGNDRVQLLVDVERFGVQAALEERRSRSVVNGGFER